MKKKLLSFVLIFALILPLAFFGSTVYAAKDDDEEESIVLGDEELRGVWVSIYDFAPLGLHKKSKAAFKKAFKSFVKRADGFGINAIFLQVRANDDAFWNSDTFPSIPQLSGITSSKAASDVYNYDPLEIAINIAHQRDIELHAWINPYRINATTYLDPGLAASQNRVKKAVTELLDYDIDGVHMDDYFYHASGGYVRPSARRNLYPIYISAAQKCANVNRLVKALYKKCHNNDCVFGISPQGNLDNDLASGADVPTWFSKKGYVDYVAPQIYWTDSSRSSLYSTRLAQFASLKKNDAKLYVGLALYRAGQSYTDDPGWREKNNNLATQVKKLRTSGAEGFLLFSAHYLFTPQTYSEVQNLAPVMEDD